jgi:hypothetical protein
MKLQRVLLTGVLLMLSAALTINAVQRNPDLLSSEEVKALVGKANTPTVHQKLARHYKALAAAKDAEAAEHKDLAAEYRAKGNTAASKHPMSGATAEHCDHFAKSTSDAAKAARDMAAAHEKMAAK